MIANNDYFESSLKTVIVAGEPCEKEVIQLHREKLPLVPLANEYGPTEVCVWCSFSSNIAAIGPFPSIGGPIANTKIYILTKFFQLTPINVIGEIYVSGNGLARGYLRQETQTGERFISSPFDATVRLYRTGDLGKYKSNGIIEFIGRVDHQTKIRGFRIEVGEIESSLRMHCNIQQAIVEVEGTDDSKHLVAYVMNQPQQDEGAHEIACDKIVDKKFNSKNNRTDDRILINHTVELESDRTKNTKYFLQNISLSGASFGSQETELLKLKQRLKLTFTLPRLNGVTLCGVVIWIEKFLLGVRWDLKGQQENELRECLNFFMIIKGYLIVNYEAFLKRNYLNI